MRLGQIPPHHAAFYRSVGRGVLQQQTLEMSAVKDSQIQFGSLHITTPLHIVGSGALRYVAGRI